MLGYCIKGKSVALSDISGDNSVFHYDTPIGGPGEAKTTCLTQHTHIVSAIMTMRTFDKIRKLSYSTSERKQYLCVRSAYTIPGPIAQCAQGFFCRLQGVDAAAAKCLIYFVP